MRSVTPHTMTLTRGAARSSGPETVPAGPDLGALGRRVLAGASAAVALHMVQRTQAVTDDARINAPAWGGEVAP